MLVAPLGAGCGEERDAIDPAPSPADLPTATESDEVPPPSEPADGAERDGTPVPLTGRVLGPDGSAEPLARVRLIGGREPGAAHEPIDPFPFAIAETRADEAGRFAMEVVLPILPHRYWLSVDGGTDVRQAISLDPSDAGWTNIEVTALTWRVVEIHLACGNQPTGAPAAHKLEVFLPDGSLVLSDGLFARDGVREPIMNALLPGRELDVLPVHTDGQRTIVRAPLPLGESVLVLRGDCGYAVQAVNVAASPTEAAPIEIVLPVEGAATFELRVAPPLPEGTEGGVGLYFGPLYTMLEIDETARGEVQRLPPGHYTYGDPSQPDCHQTVELLPSQTTTRTVEAGSCLLGLRQRAGRR